MIKWIIRNNFPSFTLQLYVNSWTLRAVTITFEKISQGNDVIVWRRKTPKEKSTRVFRARLGGENTDSVLCSRQVQPIEQRCDLPGFRCLRQSSPWQISFNWTSLSITIVFDNLTAWKRLQTIPSCLVWKTTGTGNRTAILSSQKVKCSNWAHSHRKMLKPGITKKILKRSGVYWVKILTLSRSKALLRRKEIENTYPLMPQWPTTRILRISFRVVDPRCD